jgi:cell division protein FtsL
MVQWISIVVNSILIITWLCYIFKKVSEEDFYIIILILCVFSFCILNIVQKAIYYDYKEEIENYQKIISKKNENEEKLHNIIGQYKEHLEEALNQLK